MLDALKPAVTRPLMPATRLLARTHLSATTLTVLGNVGVSAAALTLFPLNELLVGAIVCGLFAMIDLLDGPLARLKDEVSLFGAFLDPTLDRVADAAIFGGLAIRSISSNSQPSTAVLALACMASSSVISFAKARAEALGLKSQEGLAGRGERLILVLAAAGTDGMGVPHALFIGLTLLTAANFVTIVQRIAATCKAARDIEIP
ncbi:MAG: CDP-alcohol phosphatidyltransferase family protein [Frankiaceae bacterium]|nr:CDP-alcohol phosphatidyltransferase family protein [Frankiaceae bacterium]MBV9869589.1 CDP-alcohol phosphatidyltransferase family protein [Frankiaceae bacterium]